MIDSLSYKLIYLNNENTNISNVSNEVYYQEKSGFGLKIVSNNIRLLKKIKHNFELQIRNPIGTIFVIRLPLVFL